MSYKRIGELIQLVDERNKDLKINNLIGLTINKVFIPSVANIIGTDMSNYKIIRKNQFACSTMQVRRDKKMPIALLQNLDVAIISQAYPVFEVIDASEILPEYLMMWFTRSEFDREACFHAVGGVRGSLEWEDFCNLQLPIPSIDKQRAIVAEYQSIENKITINNQICEKLEATAQALYRHWFVDFEFPNEDGKPYKSSGGTMVYNEELEKEIPEGWEVGKIEDFSQIKNGYAFKSEWWTNVGIPVIKIGSIQNGFITPLELGYISLNDMVSNATRGIKGDLVIAMTGATVGKVGIIIGSYPFYMINQRVGLFSFTKKYFKSYVFFSLKQDWFNNEIQNVGGDSAQANVSDKQILNIPILVPDKEILESYHSLNCNTLEFLVITNMQNQSLIQFQSLLLSRLAKQVH